MKKTTYFFIFAAISLALFGSVNLINKVVAQEAAGIESVQYPVEELGNCQSQSACKAYCDKPENIEACLNFAQENNLMTEEEIALAKNFVAMGSKGPGGCAGRDECDNYCNDTANIDECITFAVENNLMPPEELEEAKKVQAAIKRGVKPPACKNKKECDVYCEDPNNMEECIAFGVEAGFIQGKELEDSQKMLAALKRGVKPPPCRGKEACDTYCSSPDNMEECMTFAMEAGFMTEEEKANSQKMLSALKKGVKPPNCQGKDQCDVYCQQDEHFDECLNFGEAAGFMTAEEAAMARKTRGKGPGGCKGQEECEAFCNNPDNQETCFNFGKENGLIPEADLKQMEEGKQRFKESLEQAPPAVLECLNSQVGSDLMEKFKSGAAMPPRDIGDKMKTCFEQFMGPPGEGKPGEGGMIPPGGQAGPGGCKSPEECKAYCESHPDECQNFQPGPGVINPGDQTMPQQAGPGGCKGPEECQTYCDSHPNECQNSGSGGEGQFAPGTGPSGQPGTPSQGGGGFGPGSGSMAPGTGGGQPGQPGQMGPGQPGQMGPGQPGQPGTASPEGQQGGGSTMGLENPPEGEASGQIEQRVQQQMGEIQERLNNLPPEYQQMPEVQQQIQQLQQIQQQIPQEPLLQPSPPPSSGGGGGGEALPPPQSFLGPLEIFLGQILRAFQR